MVGDMRVSRGPRAPTGSTGGVCRGGSAAIGAAPKPEEALMSTIKLNDTQLVILNAAVKAAAPIGVEAPTILKAKGASWTRAVNGLLKRRLLEEVVVKSVPPSAWGRSRHG
jgi:hypothetical protein